MSHQFREFLKKIGGGTNTSKNLTRVESAIATQMIFEGVATPAQIGAFLVAHRIKRPTCQELLGMLDTYDLLGGRLVAVPGEVVIVGNPYDGRSRTVPVTVITALILASSGVSVIMHGGDSMPTKYGLPLVKIWQGLGLDFSKLTILQIQKVLEKTGIALVYQPKHFPLAQRIVPYRDEIGKRPPFATIELVWAPYQGQAHVLAGFVHPPTERLFEELLPLRNIENFTICRGLEGSIDLSVNRPAYTRTANLGKDNVIEKCIVSAKEYGFLAGDVAFESEIQAIEEIKLVIFNRSNALWDSSVFNGGFYLWRLGLSKDLESGFIQAENLLKHNIVQKKIDQIQTILKKIYA